MNKFVKRTTVRDIEIAGNKFEVDFGKDHIRFVFQRVAEESQNVVNAIEKGLSPEDEYNAVVEANKKIFEKAINDIIGDIGASEKIFQEDKSAVFHADVYTFLVEQFMEVINAESPYNPKRVK